MDNILRKNQNAFLRNRSTTSQILTIHRNLEGVRAKILQATILFVDFAKAFDSIHRGKMEQILLAYGVPKETVAAIMILYRNTKVKVHSTDGDTDYFEIVAGVPHGDTLAPILFIICLDYVLRISIDKIKENGFELTMHTKLNICFNQTGNISTINGSSLKLVDKFTYLGSSVSSTETDIDTRLTKAWTAIDSLSVIWKSNLTDKMKRSFFQAAIMSILLYGALHGR